MMAHGGRKHSKYSASGSERWTECPGSVALSEGKPDKDNVWSVEGTQAHEVHEAALLSLIEYGGKDSVMKLPAWFSPVARSPHMFTPTHLQKSHALMFHHGTNSARFIYQLHKETPDSEILVETRVALKFIHPEMFGTFDGAVIEHFGTLHIFDYKYGAGHSVSPKKNLQMIFYAVGLAEKYGWNFKRARLWIVQPRIRGYDGPVYWDIPIHELKRYVGFFREGVARVENSPDVFKEGSWCHWCKGKGVCPLKTDKRINKAKEIFSKPIGDENGDQEKSESKTQKERQGKDQTKSKAKKSKAESQVGDFF